MHATRSSTMTVRASTPVSSIDGRQANLFNLRLYTTLCTRTDDDCSTNTVLHATPTIARVSSIKSRNGTLTTVRRQHLRHTAV